MTEQQPFKVLRTLSASGVEIRHYPEALMADVTVSGPYGQAANLGFRPLVTYISRNNIAMTAPVVQEATSESDWLVSFVMPAGMTLDELPLPSDQRVTLRKVPAHTAAAIKFSGVTTEQKIAQKETELRAALQAAGLDSVGAARVARFDPPWKPGFLRHNEIVVTLNEPA